VRGACLCRLLLLRLVARAVIVSAGTRAISALALLLAGSRRPQRVLLLCCLDGRQGDGVRQRVRLQQRDQLVHGCLLRW
jgi:hypothetical protein